MLKTRQGVKAMRRGQREEVQSPSEHILLSFFLLEDIYVIKKQRGLNSCRFDKPASAQILIPIGRQLLELSSALETQARQIPANLEMLVVMRLKCQRPLMERKISITGIMFYGDDMSTKISSKDSCLSPGNHSATFQHPEITVE